MIGQYLIGGRIMNTDKVRNRMSLGLVVGTIAGAAAAFFLAPRKGTETQKDLARKLNHFAQKSILKTQDTLIKFEDALESDLDKEEENLYL